MLPQIVYANKKKQEDTFFSAEFYDASRSPNAPRHVKTSGITQPMAHAVPYFYCIFKKMDDEERERAKGFLGKISSRAQQPALVIDLIMDNISKKIEVLKKAEELKEASTIDQLIE